MAKFNIPSNPQQEEQIIDFGNFVRKYKRYWWLFLLSLIACMTLAFAYLKYAKRVYNIKAVVLIAQDDNSAGAGANLLKGMKLMGQGSKVDDEMIVFSSQELCTQVAKQLQKHVDAIKKICAKNNLNIYSDHSLDGTSCLYLVPDNMHCLTDDNSGEVIDLEKIPYLDFDARGFDPNYDFFRR